MKYKWITILLIFVVIIISFIGGSKYFINGIQENKYRFYHETNQCSSNETEFCTHLPLVVIDTNGQDIPGENHEKDTILTNIKIIDNKEGGNHLSDKADVVTESNIRYRGNSSLKFDKKGYLLKFVTENGEENKQKVMGMEKHDEWVLHGPFIDKTLLRNYLWYHISGEIMEYAPDSRFCELYVDGEYQGVYLMVESASRGDNSRIQINKYKKGNPFTSYIVRLDREEPDPNENLNNFTKYTYINDPDSSFSIVYPGSAIITPELKRYIEEDITKFEKKLYSFDYDSHRFGYETFINAKEFADYFLINEFTQNYDAGFYSTYLYKDVKGKFGLYVWDFNSANDNYDKDIDINAFGLHKSIWFEMLLKDEDFTNQVINEYKYLRNHALNEEYLLGYIDAIINYLGDAVTRNFEVWGYTFDGFDVFFADSKKNIPSYEDAITQIKNHIIERGKFLDQYIVTIKQFSSESKVKKYNH